MRPFRRNALHLARACAQERHGAGLRAPIFSSPVNNAAMSPPPRHPDGEGSSSEFDLLAEEDGDDALDSYGAPSLSLPSQRALGRRTDELQEEMEMLEGAVRCEHATTSECSPCALSNS